MGRGRMIQCHDMSLKIDGYGLILV
jgi:hypothetical protein